MQWGGWVIGMGGCGWVGWVGVRVGCKCREPGPVVAAIPDNPLATPPNKDKEAAGGNADPTHPHTQRKQTSTKYETTHGHRDQETGHITEASLDTPSTASGQLRPDSASRPSAHLTSPPSPPPTPSHPSPPPTPSHFDHTNPLIPLSRPLSPLLPLGGPYPPYSP